MKKSTFSFFEMIKSSHLVVVVGGGGGGGGPQSTPHLVFVYIPVMIYSKEGKVVGKKATIHPCLKICLQIWV